MSLRLNGSTSGYVEINAPAVAGTTNVTIPATSGEVAIQATDGSVDLGNVNIDSSGRLLVGTSSAQGSSTVTIQQTVANSAPLALRYTNTNDNQIGIDFYRSRSSSAKVESTDPLMRLDAYGYDGSAYRKGASIEAIVDAATSAGDMPCRLVFSTTSDGAPSPTERMRITSDGDILIGTTAIPNGISVHGAAFEDSSANRQVLKTASSFTTGTTLVAFYNPNGNVGTIATTGSATAYNTSSDYRLKENVTAVTDGITRLQQLKPSRFNFIADPDTIVDGFIAHEAQEVVPECVTGEKDAVDDEGNPEYQGIDQSKLVPLLTAALQEAIGRIETQAAAIAALETRLTALEGGTAQ